jgi:hypothetical protein
MTEPQTVADSSPTSPTSLVFAQTDSQLLVGALWQGAGSWGALLLAWVLAGSFPPPSLHGPALAAVLAAGLLWSIVLVLGLARALGRRPIVLDSAGIRCSGATFVPWWQIEGIEEVPATWALPRHLRLVVGGSHDQELRSPLDGSWAPDPDFDEKADAIAAWWVAYRGAAWAPGPRTGNPAGVTRLAPRAVRPTWLPPPPRG